ncbi:MAG: hypothetical protein IPK10_07475 [Bacteroidetes bacterium]|nr:hypothetical protein [Bacteroidota bacterium]
MKTKTLLTLLILRSFILNSQDIKNQYNMPPIVNELAWGTFINTPGNGLAVSYNIETVSFPFIADCIKLPIGCGINNPVLNRNFTLPNDAYDFTFDKWDYIKRKNFKY